MEFAESNQRSTGSALPSFLCSLSIFPILFPTVILRTTIAISIDATMRFLSPILSYPIHLVQTRSPLLIYHTVPHKAHDTPSPPTNTTQIPLPPPHPPASHPPSPPPIPYPPIPLPKLQFPTTYLPSTPISSTNLQDKTHNRRFPPLPPSRLSHLSNLRFQRRSIRGDRDGA